MERGWLGPLWILSAFVMNRLPDSVAKLICMGSSSPGWVLGVGTGKGSQS